MALEPRYLFDGAGVATVVEASHHTNPFVAAPHGPDPLAEAIANHVLPADPTVGVSAPTQIKAADPSQTGGKKEVAFVDTSVSDWQALANGAPAGVEVDLIDGRQSGLAQIAKWAETHSGYDVINILSQGREATLKVGTDTLTDASLSTTTVQVELAEIGHALNAGGEVQLYGSNIGAGADGQTFVADFAADTGTVVVAADHAVGNAGQGGSWTLDVATAPTCVTPLSIPGYLGTLDVGATVTDTSPMPVEVQAANPSLDGGKTEVAFIDTSVVDWQVLANGVRPGVEIELIDGTQSGLAQMAAWASTHSGYDAIHVLSHGAEASLTLGTDTLTDGSLSAPVVRAELTEIGSALNAGGEILLYGCDVAKGNDGQQFINDVAADTGAVVAASTDLTGSAALGGNWFLEDSTGAIKESSLQVNNYPYVLTVSSPTTVAMSPGGDTSNPFETPLDVGTGVYITSADGSASANLSGIDYAGNYWYINPANSTITYVSKAGNEGNWTLPIDIYFSGGSLLAVTGVTLTSATPGFGTITAVLDSGTGIKFTPPNPDPGSGLHFGTWGAGNGAKSGTTDSYTYVWTFTSTNTGGNSAPTDLSISAATVNQSGGSNAAVGTLSTTDPDSGDSFTYSLVSGNGTNDADNGSFNISGSTLRANDASSLAAGTYHVYVETNDGHSHTFDKALTITVVDNTTPTNISLSSSSVNQSGGSNATVGTFSSTDVGPSTYTYSLVAGNGTNDANNGSFNISGGTLRANNSSSLAAGNYAIYVRTTDAAGHSYDKALTVTVVDNTTPTDLSLTSTSVNQSGGTNATVGTFSSTDVGPSTYTYSLVAGNGTNDADNGSFNISGGTLRANNASNLAAGSYHVYVRTSDGAGHTFDKALTITVADNTTPSNIALTSTSVNQSGGANATVGTFSSTDVGPSTYTYTLVAGNGTNDADNGSFNISGGTLRANNSSNLAAGNYAIYVRTTDAAGHSFDKAFTIAVVDNTTPTSIALTSTSVSQAAGSNASVGTLSSTDVGPSTYTYTLVAGNGTNDADNGSFNISGSTLRVNDSTG
ncbi:MAG: DUF4347 domain-containing protein, partial [Rhodospirillaceae bacterium]